VRVLGGRWGALLLFLLALGVYAVEALAWPVAATFGRDSHEYLVYYLDFFNSSPLFPQVMLTHTPVAPLFLGGLLDAGGVQAVEIGLALTFAGSVVAFATAASRFGLAAGALTGIALVAWPPYGALFHQVDSDGLFAFGFALLTLLVVDTSRRPSTWRFVANGLLVAGLVLIRPSSGFLLVFVGFPLLLAGTWRTRLCWSGAFLAAALLPLFLWAGVNEIRYDDYTVSRDGWANVPFWRVLMVNHTVSADNGPASRELVAAIEDDLLKRKPYTSYGIGLDPFLSRPPWTAWWDIVALNDRTFGWGDDGRTLFRVAMESIYHHPGTYFASVGRTFWRALDNRTQVHFDSNTAGSLTPARNVATTLVEGRRLPAKLVAPAIGFTAASRPDGQVLSRWPTPADPDLRFPEAAKQRRLTSFTRTLQDWEQPAREPSARVADWLNGFELRYPRLWLWVVVAAVALVLRRPRGVLPLLAMAAIGLALTLFYALSFPPIYQFVLSTAPALITLTIVALTGERRRFASGVSEG
jgi:hypothetical protein